MSVVNGKANAATVLYASLPKDLVSAQWVDMMLESGRKTLAEDTEECVLYRQMLQCIDLYDRWCQLLKEKPEPGSVRHSREFTVWKNRMVKETVDTEQKLTQFLSAAQVTQNNEGLYFYRF